MFMQSRKQVIKKIHFHKIKLVLSVNTNFWCTMIEGIRIWLMMVMNFNITISHHSPNFKVLSKVNGCFQVKKRIK